MHRSILPIVLVCTLTLLVFTPTLTLAQFTPDGVDTLVIIDSDGAVTVQGDTRMTLITEDPGVRYAWTYDHPFDAVLEFRFDPRTFDVDRPQQVVPLLEDPENPYPLFEFLPSPEVWDTDVPARVYNHTSQGTTTILRIQIPAVDGPEQTLILERDVTPPGYTIGPLEDLTHNSFGVNTTTTEFALAELQRRPAGTDEEWIPLPTTAFNTQQRFPVVGLDAETEYDVRIVFTDWAGNRNESDTYKVTTLPRGSGVLPEFEILTPLPDERVTEAREIPIQVRITADGAEISPNSVRLYIDLEEVHRDDLFVDDLLTYTFDGREPGSYVVVVEATTTEAGSDHVRWTFHVGDEPEGQESPSLGALVFVALTGLMLLAVRRRTA